ncbi:MAG: Lrp/AsnC family transcriptional regulator [Planctomycetota bacterium]
MPLKGLDNTDRKILEILRDDGRITNIEIADRVSLSPSPCLRRVKRLESEGVIRGYGAYLDGKKMGWEITAFIHLNIEKHRKSDSVYFKQQLAEIDQVVWCLALAGNWDLLLLVAALNLDDYFELAQKIGGLEYVKEIQSTIVVGEIKTFNGLPIPDTT